ncbi:MAG: fimbrillin family protein [Bacteroidaceae bacterium]|nr:fimbrillin family protein [Bacteroidaceae bacterium]
MRKCREFGWIIGLLLIVACSEGKDEPEVNKPEQPEQTAVGNLPADGAPIAFSASINEEADTRALTYGNDIVYSAITRDGGGDVTSISFHDGIEDNDDLKQTGFGVYSFYTGEKLVGGTGDDKPTIVKDKEIVMLNQQVTWDAVNSKWTYTPMRFWPGSENYMSFYAYAPWSSTIYPSIGDKASDGDYSKQTSTSYGMKGTYTFNYNKDIKVPSVVWNFDEQQDVVWGMNRDTNKPFQNIHRSDTDNGTLHWKFQHELARVKFSIFNFKDILDIYQESTAGVIPNGLSVTPNGGTVGAGGVDAYSFHYTATGADGEGPTGYYARLYEKSGENALCHKFEELDNSAMLIITSIEIKNLVTGATLNHDASVDGGVSWSDKTTTTTYEIPPGLLNPKFYKASSEISSITFGDDWSSFPSLGVETLPLTVPTGEGMDGKSHYFLMVPKEVNANTEDELALVIKYKIIRRFKLTGNYTLDNEVPKPNTGAFDFEWTGVLGTTLEPQTLEAPLNVAFEANHSYHIAIRLGKMMQVEFEVTDWDDNDAGGINVSIPSFE